MKYIFIIPIILLFVSCKNIEPKKLFGSWKMKDVVDQTGKNASEKTTFYKGDSVVVEKFENKKLIDKFSSEYKFDTISNMIHIHPGKLLDETIKLDFKVLKLTDSEMELSNTKQKKLIRLIRAE